MRSIPDRVKPDYKIGICCFSTKHVALGERAKTGWLGIRILHLSGATCLSNYNTGNNALFRKWNEEMFDYFTPLFKWFVTPFSWFDARAVHIPIIIRQELFEEIETVIKIVLSGSCVFRATVLSKAAATFVLVLTVSLVSCSTSSVKKTIM